MNNPVVTVMHGIRFILILVGVLLTSCQKDIAQREPTGFNYALALDGATTFMKVPRIASYQLAAFTLEVMVRFDEVHAGLMPIIAETDRDQWNRADGFSLVYERGHIVLRLAKTAREAFAFSTPYPVQAGRWYHIAASFDGRTGRLSMNGQLVLEQEQEFPVYYGDAGFSIGRARNSQYGGDVFFKGQIDEVRIWNHVRSASQVTDHSRRPLQGDEPGLVGYWNFDDRNNNLEPAMDRSIVRNHGEFSGKLRFVQSTALEAR